MTLATNALPAFPRVSRLAWPAILLGLLATLPGCDMLGFGAQIFNGDDARAQVEAQYTDLEKQRVAVMVAASDDTLFHHPRARPAMTSTISRQIAKNVKGVSLMNPKKIIDYQVENPYWHTLPYSKVMEVIEVDRLIVIDIVDYRTHQAGNRHIYRGLISANVGVLEAEAKNPDNFAFRTQVRAQYPRTADSKVGAVNADEQTIELGVIKRFTAKAAGLFYEHKEVK